MVTVTRLRGRPAPAMAGNMLLRDWFAGQALAGMWAVNAGNYGTRQLAEDAYAMADAMLAARSKEASSPEVTFLQAELDEAKARIESLEQLRPHWAQGYSSDSIAAQTATSALSSIWALLGVQHQTAAVARIKGLLAAGTSK